MPIRLMQSTAGVGMARPVRLASQVNHWYLICLAGLIVGCAPMFEVEAKEDAMSNKNMTLWKKIERVAQLIPFTKAKIETLFSTVLSEKRRSSHTVYLVGQDIDLGHGWLIAKVDLRRGEAAKDPGILVLEVGGSCTTIEQVRDHYAELKITGIPTGRSSSEETSHTAEAPWGKLSFGFAARDPKCLASVTFAPMPLC